MSIQTHGYATGEKRTSTYNIWVAMLKRCRNPKNKSYSNYGGRGIFVCDEWTHFEKFLQDMGERPPGLTLDRKDNDGPYCKENCRWVPLSVQNRNKTDTWRLTYKGRTQCAAEWAREIGCSRERIYYRLRKGMDAENVIELLRTKP